MLRLQSIKILTLALLCALLLPLALPRVLPMVDSEIASAQEDDGDGVDWDKYDEGDDDEDDDDDKLDPEPEDFDDRLEWIRMHLSGELGKRIQRLIALTECGYLNTPELVSDMLETIKDFDHEKETVRIALFNLARMDEWVLKAGGGLELVDELVRRYNTITKGDEYAKEQMGKLFHKITKTKGNFRNDFGVINNMWKDKKRRGRYESSGKKLMKKFRDSQTKVSSDSLPRSYDDANLFTEIYYYGRYPIDLFFFIDVAPLQQGQEWDLQINRESMNLIDLLMSFTPRLRVGLVTFADEDLDHLAMTTRLLEVKNIIAGLGHKVKKSEQVAVGFVMALQWANRNTPWALNGKRVGVVVADQENGSGGLRDTLDRVLDDIDFSGLHVAGHYAITQEPSSAPGFFKRAAKNTGGIATYARHLDMLADDIAPLAYTDNEDALKEIKILFTELLKQFRMTKKNDLPFGHKDR